MKVLGIVGSPRKGGNSDDLVDRVLEGAKSRGTEVEKIYLRDLEIHPCQGAFSCEAAQRCILPDDMQKVYPKLREATGIVIGTPIYMGDVAAPLLNFLDRCRPFISYLDSLCGPNMSPEKKKLQKEKTCLHLWKGEKTYSELGSGAEEAMEAVIKLYTDKHVTHPVPARRLEKGKKGVLILSYHRHGEDTYQRVIDFLLFNLRDLWGVDIVDILPASLLLKRGDAQRREDLMARAFKIGQSM
jgi:multimeric flavodoxin WrbA